MKIIVLDFSLCACYVYDYDGTINSENEEDVLNLLGHQLSNCHFMYSENIDIIYNDETDV